MFRLFLILILSLNITNYSFSNEKNKEDYNLLNNKLTIFINSKEYDKKTFKQVEKILDHIQIVLDPYKSNSFVSKFNKLERNTQISAPDLFVDSFRMLSDYHKITKGGFDPTIFSILANTSKTSRVKYLLNSGLYDKCISLASITIKISNVFSKRHSCTKISFDAVIDGIVVENVRYFLEKQNISSFYISFGNTYYSKNYSSNPTSFNRTVKDVLEDNKINLNDIASYSFLDNFSRDKLKTFHINANKKDLVYENNIFVIVASNSPHNNSILANTFNLLDIEKMDPDDYIQSETPIFIIYEDQLGYRTFLSKNFEEYLDPSE